MLRYFNKLAWLYIPCIFEFQHFPEARVSKSKLLNWKNVRSMKSFQFYENRNFILLKDHGTRHLFYKTILDQVEKIKQEAKLYGIVLTRIFLKFTDILYQYSESK